MCTVPTVPEIQVFYFVCALITPETGLWCSKVLIFVSCGPEKKTNPDKLLLV